MKKLFKLIWIQLKVKLGLSVLKSMLKGNARDRMKVLGSVVLFVFVIASLLSTYLFIFNALLDAVIALPGNLVQNLFSMLFALGVLLVLVFGIFYSMGLYYAKDAELLASLPVKKSATYLAKFIPALLGEMTLFAFIALPGIIIYGIRTAAGPGLYIFGILSVLLLPLLPFAIANIVASLLMSISIVARHRERIATIGSFILFAVFFVVNQLFSMNASNIDNETIGNLLQGGTIAVITRIFSTTAWAADALINKSLSSLVFLLAVSAVALAVCIAISGRLYLSGALAQKETAKSRRRIDINSAAQKTSSPVTAILNKEWKTVLRSTAYAMNSLISIILGPLMIIMIFVVQLPGDDVQEFTHIFQMLRSNSTIVWAGSACLVFLIASLNFASWTVYSREGRAMWIMKMVPQHAKQILNGKLLFGISIPAVAALTSTLTLMFVLNINITGAILVFFSSVILCLPSVVFGTLLDLMYPRLNWESETKAIKQNINGLITMMVNFLFAAAVVFAFILLTNTLKISPEISWAILIAAVALLSMLLYSVAVRKSSALQERIMG